ncbi:gamma-aminobutyric acid type B receptor subunit 2 isoform X1 [Formica exsecta]|uniref:gamma-aminobutyric acid type B receptor subunit 2 isoform X1 n=1 Tax=Formica exsecta TaxID=72781 RepID=UPI001143895E|nr:gamma-aminobutyric acid type B receptor subunit 2 isoform X1 [Formica exsecta]
MKVRASRDVVETDRMKRTDGMGTAGKIPVTAATVTTIGDRASRSLALLAVIAWCSCWLLLIGECAGQKPINLGSSKKRDVYIAGFFPYGNHVPEGHIGRGVMPAVKLAVEHINEHATILRDYRLHMWWNDTECSAAVGMKAFFDMMHNGPHKVILFGGACTQVTDPIAKASKHWRLTQLSYADTHPMFTTNSFPNFFRVVPSENALNAPRVALLVHFNWTRVGTIYQNEPRYALVHNRLVADLDESKMELVETLSFATEVRTALEKLKEKDVRIVLGNFNEAWARRIFCEAYRFGLYGRKYQWVIIGTYTREWWLRPDGGCDPAELSEALHGVILTDLLPLTSEEQHTTSGITPVQYQVEYDSRRGSEYSRFHGYTYDGIWTIALAVKNVARRIRHFHRNQTISDFRYRDVLWEKLFLDALRNTSFDGVTGPVRFYDNERKAYILLKQFQNGQEVNVGEYDSITGVLDLTRGAPLWNGRSPPKDRTVRIIEHSTVDITLYAVLASAASVGIVLASIFLAINIRYRNQRYIKMSSPHLNNLIIVGCMLTYSSVIFLGLDSQLSSVAAFPYICTARAWLLMAGFSLAFGSMFSKTWRVHSIFTDVKLNKKVIKDYQLFMIVGILLAVDLTIMTTWQIADPFYRAIKQMQPYHHPSSEDIIIIPENEYCQSNQMNIYLFCIYAYKGLLMIFGAFLAWETRHVSIPALNDSKYVGMSVYNVVIMCVTGAAISFVLTDKQDAMFIMLAVFIIFCSTATLCLVFIPKVIELRRNPQGAINKRTRATLRPMLKIRRDSTVSEIDERLKEAKLANKKFRKQLLQKDSELQGFLRRMGEETANETQETVDTLPVPKPEEAVKREGPSITTETTDVSMSICSLNSSTVSQPEGDYVNVDQVTKKRSSVTKATSITIDNERVAMTAQIEESSSPGVETTTDAFPPLPLPSTTMTIAMTTTTMTTTTTAMATAMATATATAVTPTTTHSRHTCGADASRRKSASDETGKTSEPMLLIRNKSQEPLPNEAATTTRFVPPVVEESDSVILEETEIARHVCRVRRRSKDERRAKLSTPPPTKNVSFGELHEQSYIEQVIMPFPLTQYVPNHRHAEKYEESMSTIIQRSMSERSREKCLRLHISGGHPIVECSHRVARRMCRHAGSKLRHQARLEYVQSTPNVATMHNGKHVAANSRGGTGDVNGDSAVNVSKMYSAVSDGELLDLTILPIFQKLLTERHKSTARRGYRSNIASCPNISIKCDIVEYL